MKPTSCTATTRGEALLKGSFSGAAAHAFHLVSRLLLTPYVIASTGVAAYGFWSLLFLTFGVLGLHRLGFAVAATAQAARFSAVGDRERLSAALRTSASAALAFGAALGVPLFFGARPLCALLAVPPELLDDATAAWRVALVAVVVAMAGGSYQSALEGLRAHPQVRAAEVVASALETALVFAFAPRFGLPGMAAAFAVRLLAPLPWFAYLLRRAAPGVGALPGRVDRELLRESWRTGLGVQAVGVLQVAGASLDRWLTAGFLSLAATGACEAARKLAGFAAALPAQALGPLLPAAAARAAAGRRDELARLASVSTRAVTTAGAAPLAVCACFPEAVLTAWLGAPPDGAVAALRYAAPAALLHLATGPATAVLRGLGRPGLEVFFSVVWLLSSAAFLPLGLRGGSTASAAAAASAAQFLAAAVLLLRAAPRLGTTRVALLFRDALRPAALVGAPVLLWRLAAGTAAYERRAAAAAALAAPVLVALAAAGLVAWRVVLDGEGRRRFSSYLRPRPSVAAETVP